MSVKLRALAQRSSKHSLDRNEPEKITNTLEGRISTQRSRLEPAIYQISQGNHHGVANRTLN